MKKSFFFLAFFLTSIYHIKAQNIYFTKYFLQQGLERHLVDVVSLLSSHQMNSTSVVESLINVIKLQNSDQFDKAFSCFSLEEEEKNLILGVVHLIQGKKNKTLKHLKHARWKFASKNENSKKNLCDILISLSRIIFQPEKSEIKKITQKIENAENLKGLLLPEITFILYEIAKTFQMEKTAALLNHIILKNGLNKVNATYKPLMEIITQKNEITSAEKLIVDLLKKRGLKNYLIIPLSCALADVYIFHGKYKQALAILYKYYNYKNINAFDYQNLCISLAESNFHIGETKNSFSIIKKINNYVSEEKYIYQYCVLLLLEGEMNRMSDEVKKASNNFWIVQKISLDRGFNNLRLNAELGIADVLRITSETNRSYELYKRIIALSHNNEVVLGRALRGIGLVDFKTAEYKKSYKHLIQAVNISDKKRDYLNVNKSLISLGRLQLWQGNYSEARVFYEKALLLANEMDNPWLKVQIFTYLGDLERIQSKHQNSRALYLKAIYYAKQVNDRAKHAMALFGMAVLDINAGLYELAQNRLKDALSVYQSIQHKQGMGITLTEIGKIYLFQKDLEAAEKIFKNAFDIYEEIGDKYGLVKSLQNLGKLREKQKKFKQGKLALLEALKLANEMHNEREKAKTEYLLAQLYYKTGNYSVSLDYLSHALTLIEKLRDPLIAHKINSLIDDIKKKTSNSK